jgi:predicted nucleotidyltransferase component of viral defense system
MNKIAYAPDKERAVVFEDVADKTGLTTFIVEKDFWVSWVLGEIFKDEYLSQILCFKGGTSLSKVFHLIERFSEDIDLILSHETVLEAGEQLEQPSSSKQAKFNEVVERRAEVFIATELRDIIAHSLGDVCAVTGDANDGHILYVRFPRVFDYSYIKPEVKLEIGPLSLWHPNEKYPVSSFLGDVYPDLIPEQPLVPTIKPERTFWEKITILHHEHNRPESSTPLPRYSRHYYDVYRIGHSKVKDEALQRLDLLEEVVKFKKRFYPRGWAKYDEAKPGTMRLSPAQHNLSVLRQDYEKMSAMIYGEKPQWEELLQYLRFLEEEINEIPR